MINKMFVYEYKDQFNYYNLIRKINKDYRLIYDTKNKLFIIINSANNDEICLKFKSFNQNIVKILQETSIVNSHKLFRKIDEDNSKLVELAQRKQRENLSSSIAELEKFSKRVSKVLPSDINKILGVNNG